MESDRAIAQSKRVADREGAESGGSDGIGRVHPTDPDDGPAGVGVGEGCAVLVGRLVQGQGAVADLGEGDIAVQRPGEGGGLSLTRVDRQDRSGTAVDDPAGAGETRDGEVLPVEIKAGSVVDGNVDESARGHSGVVGELQDAFLHRQVAEGSEGRCHDIGRTGKEERSCARFGEVERLEIAGDRGIAGLAATGPDEGLLGCDTRAEAEIAADRRSCRAVHDQTAVHEAQERRAVGRSDVGAGAEGKDVDTTCRHGLSGAKITEGGDSGRGQIGGCRGIVQQEAVGGVVAQEVQILTGTGATDDRRQGEDAAGIGLGGAGEESLIHPEIGGEIRGDQSQHAVGLTGERCGSERVGDGGAFDQLERSRASVVEGRHRQSGNRHGEGEGGRRTHDGRGRSTQRDGGAADIGNDRAGRDIGA